MPDPIVNFFTRIFQWIGRGIGFVVGLIARPFMWLGRWYVERGWILKSMLGAIVLVVIGLYANFFYVTQLWNGLQSRLSGSTLPRFRRQPRQPMPWPVSRSPLLPGAGAGGDRAAGTRPAELQALRDRRRRRRPGRLQRQPECLDLLDDRVEARLLRHPWRNTPFFDNKAAFQLGINQVLRRTTTELVDTLGRVRGTSQIDQNLQDARTAIAWDEDAWYIGLRGPTRPTPSVYREAIRQAASRSTPASKTARPPSMPAPTTSSSSSTASPATSARPPTSCAAGSRLQRRLVRPARRRPLLVRLWPALCLLRNPERDPLGLFVGHPRAQSRHAVGHHADPDAGRPQHAALDHLQRQRVELHLPFASGDDGLQPVARPLADRRNPRRARPLTPPWLR